MRKGLTGVVLAVVIGAAATATAFDNDDLTLVVTDDQDGLTDRLRAASLVAQAIEDERTAPDELLAAARGEYRQLLGTLYGAGYYNPVITVRVDGREAADLSPLRVPSQINRVEIVVEAGDPFTFGQTEISPLAPGTELPEDFTAGARARVPVIEQAARRAVSGWRNLGYAKATLDREVITADHARELINVDIGVATGPKLRFGPLEVRGNQRVRTDRILEIAGLPVGATYDPAELEDAADRLRRSGAFRSVSLRDADQVGPGDQLAITADLLEEKRRRLGAGVEISSEEGLELSAYWLHRNLLGGAERLRFDARVSDIGARDSDNGIDMLLGVSFRRPATFHPDVDLTLGAVLNREDEPGYFSDRIDIGGTLTWRQSDELELSAGLLFSAAQVEDAFGERDYTRLGVPLDVTWDRRDNEFNATRGFFLRATAMPFVGLSGIDSGALLELDGRVYRAVGSRVVLAGRVQTGNLFGPEIQDAPPEDLFYAGGGGSVRGQPFQILGAGDVDGDEFGGRTYLALSGEARVTVRGPIGVVGFYDAGYVGEEEFYDGSGEWISGAGLGLRYDTGFGPIRFDVATPLESVDDEDVSNVQIYIGIGQAF